MLPPRWLTCAVLIGVVPSAAWGQGASTEAPSGETERDEPEAAQEAVQDAEETPPAEPAGPTLADVERRQAAHQHAIEIAEPRPPEPDVVLPEAPAWQRHIEIGGDFAFVVRPLAGAENDAGTSYSPAPAWGLHLRWSMLSWLRFHAYFVDAHHQVELAAGALTPNLPNGVSGDATFSEFSVATFVFGARLAPTWNISDRFRAWVGAGVGWGRFEFPTMIVTEGSGQQYEVRERSGVFVEFPFSLGASFDVIERWLALELELTAAPVTGQSGSAHRSFQATDADGNIRTVAAFGAIEASFVQTLGLSLVL